MRMLEEGEPSIRVLARPIYDRMNVIPVNLRDGEEEIVARRLRDILTGEGE